MLGLIMKDVKGYEGLYKVDNYGNIYSLNYRRSGRTGRIKTWNHRGYKRVSLFNSGGSSYILVHRLVAQAFISNAENKPEVNHLDGCKSNNRVSNLEWATSSENRGHAVDHGLHKSPCLKGSKHGMAKLTEDAVRDIKLSLAQGETGTSIAKKFDVCTSSISQIKNRKIWSHVQ